eukprot:73001_1
MVDIVYEDQGNDISWYSKPIPNGSAPNNFARIIELRKAFCHPLTINKDGSLNDKYFSNVTHETAMNWNDIELLQLYEGIYKHGVSNVQSWIKIQSDFLPQRDFIEVRLKLCQMFGCQDLSKYNGRSFKSEKEIEDEFNKNKAEGAQAGNWNTKCNVSFKPNVANLTREEVRQLQQKELDDWKKYIYNNPMYVYRTNAKASNTKKGRKASKRKSKKKKQKPAAKKTQKNTIDKMLKKQNAEKKENEMDVDEEMTDNSKNKNQKEEVVPPQVPVLEKVKESKTKNKNTKRKKKTTKRKKKNAPLMPEDSEDEDMLCVE